MNNDRKTLEVGVHTTLRKQFGECMWEIALID